jgi:hypothetical protein
MRMADSMTGRPFGGKQEQSDEIERSVNAGLPDGWFELARVLEQSGE